MKHCCILIILMTSLSATQAMFFDEDDPNSFWPSQTSHFLMYCLRDTYRSPSERIAINDELITRELDASVYNRIPARYLGDMLTVAVFTTRRVDKVRKIMESRQFNAIQPEHLGVALRNASEIDSEEIVAMLLGHQRSLQIPTMCFYSAIIKSRHQNILARLCQHSQFEQVKIEYANCSIVQDLIEQPPQYTDQACFTKNANTVNDLTMAGDNIDDADNASYFDCCRRFLCCCFSYEE